MKLRQVTRQREVTKRVDGEDVTFDEDYTESVPRIPFNLDALLRKALFVAAILMTVGAIVWGTVAIGSMLNQLAPGWGYVVAGVFDLAWAACLVAEYLNRYDDEKIKLPRNAGVAALLVSMAAIVWHGHLVDAVFVGVIGAAVSLAAKGVWFIAMETTRVRLDKEYQVLLRQRQQRAGLRKSLAQSKRDEYLMDDETARLLAALEFERGTTITAEQVRPEPANTEAITAEPVREQLANIAANTAVTSEFAVPEPTNIAELVREQIANGSPNKDVVAAVLAAVPTANKDSVAATVRRERKKLDGPYL
jgi:hypothetical protein